MYIEKDLMEECQRYFKKRKVFHRLFLGFRKKYESLGRFGGTVLLKNLSEEEKEELGGFFQKDYHQNRSVTISAAAMERALNRSRFSEFSWNQILREYFGEELEGKKEKEQQEKEKQIQFFSEIAERYADEKGKIWMQTILSEKRKGYAIFQQQYKEDPENLKKVLIHILNSIPQLPVFKGKRERLAVFAAQMTGDPHFYDVGTLAEHLLILFIRFYFPMEETESRMGPEQKNMELYHAGILRDDVSNHVLAYGIHGRDRDGNQHPGLDGFCIRKEPMILTLHTLGMMEIMFSTDGVVYVVENPAVFSWLCEQHPEKSFVCTNGQLRLASLVLLDLLSKNNLLYYAGDYDPEGLLIAQTVIKRYEGRAKLWQYCLEHYMANLSTVDLSESRLRKLDKIDEEILQVIADAMREQKKAAYQENMLKVYRL